VRRPAVLVAGVALGIAIGPGRASRAHAQPAVETPPVVETPPPAAPGGTTDPSIDAKLRAPERVPDNPAIDLLGAADLQPVKPGSTKDLGAELRALYRNGKVVPQVAIELSPFALTLGRSSTYGDYQRPYVRWLRRITLSLATTSAGEGDDEAILGAVGARFRIIDGTDWRLNENAVACALAAAELAAPTPAPTSPGVAAAPAPPSAASQRVAQCFRDHAARWNARQWALGVAMSSGFPKGELTADLRDLAAWTSTALGLGARGQVVLAGKYLFADARSEGGMHTSEQHTAAATLQLELRDARYGMIVTGGGGARWRRDMTSWERHAVGVFGAEFQLAIAEDKWVALRVSGELDGGARDSAISIVNLKWDYDVTEGK
jgi:hypothetical protein